MGEQKYWIILVKGKGSYAPIRDVGGKPLLFVGKEKARQYLRNHQFLASPLLIEVPVQSAQGGKDARATGEGE